MKRSGRDWAPIVALGMGGLLALAGLGLLGSSLAQVARQPSAGVTPTTSVATTATDAPALSPTPTATEPPTPSATPTPTATPVSTPTPVDCYEFGDFPYYPGSLAVAASTQDARAWHVDVAASQVATYYTKGASQLAWQFQLLSRTATQWNYRISRAPACTGTLFVRVDPAGGTLYQATPDS